GGFDVFHGQLIANDGVPAYWPMFCMSYDVTAGLYLACLLHRRSSDTPQPLGRRAIGPHVQSELEADSALQANAAASFRRLERAHVLALMSAREHGRVRWHMRVWGLRQRDMKASARQVLRTAGAATNAGMGRVPPATAGGATVSPLTPMPVPAGLPE